MNRESKNVSSMKNVLIGGVNQVVCLALSFAAKTVFIRTLGVVYLGINGLFTNLYLLISSIDFGVGIAMMYALYEPLELCDEERVAAIYDFFKRLYRRIAVIDLGIGLALFPFLNLIFDVQGKTQVSIQWYYVLFFANTMLYNRCNYKSYIIIADQKKYITSFYLMLFEGGTYAAQIAVLLLTGDYRWYLVLTILKTAGYTFYMKHRAEQMYPYIRKKPKPLSETEQQRLRTDSWHNVVYKFTEMMLSGTDNLIISVMIGTVSVGYYSNYEFIIQGVTSMTALIFASVAASVGHLFAEQNHEKNLRVFACAQDFNLWLAGVMTTALVVLTQDFIRVWVGAAYVLSWKIVGIIIFNFYLCVQRDAMKVFRESAGMFDKITRVGLANAVLNIVLSVLFGMLWGFAGIFFATVVSGLLTSYWFEPYLFHKEYLHTSIKPYVKKQAIGLLLVGMSIFITGLCAGFVTLGGWGGLFLKAAICLAVSNGIYLLAGRNTEAFHEVLRIVQK